MKNIAFIAVLSCLIGSLFTSVCFGDGYTYIDSNAGGVNVELKNSDNPADGPPVATIIKDAQKLFPKYIAEAKLPAAKSFFVKDYITRKVRAASWQPIDHIEAQIIAVTKPVTADGSYYLYNCEVHYDRPIGATKWTVRKDESTITLGDGKPKTGGIHLINSKNEDLTLQQSTKDQEEANKAAQKQQEEYDRQQADRKRRPARQDSSTESSDVQIPDSAKGGSSNSDDGNTIQKGLKKFLPF